VSKQLWAKHRREAVLPQCHAPQQVFGDVSRIPLFWTGQTMVSEEAFAAERMAAEFQASPVTSAERERVDALLEWENLRDTINPLAVIEFLKRHPEGPSAELARRRLAEIEADRWRLIRDSSSEKTLTDFLEIFPDGKNYVAAEARLARLRKTREQQDWEKICRSSDPSVLDRFAEIWPDGVYVKEAMAKAIALRDEAERWSKFKESDDPTPLRRILDDYPDGAYKKEIESLIRMLGIQHKSTSCGPLSLEKAAKKVSGWILAVIFVPIFIAGVLLGIAGLYTGDIILVVIAMVICWISARNLDYIGFIKL
jgi:hypothetical protein